jgi:hypothetical protein
MPPETRRRRFRYRLVSAVHLPRAEAPSLYLIRYSVVVKPFLALARNDVGTTGFQPEVLEAVPGLGAAGGRCLNAQRVAINRVNSAISFCTLAMAFASIAR